MRGKRDDQSLDVESPRTPPEDVPAAESSVEPGNDTTRRLESTERESADFKDRYLRLYAEFENFKKRAQRDQIDHMKYATEKMLRDLLPVVDNLERAVAHARTRNADQTIIDGLDLTIRQFQDALAKSGVDPIVALGQPFDPALHQALAQVDATDREPGMVVEEAQRGYRLHGRILRPSLVTVAKSPAENSGNQG